MSWRIHPVQTWWQNKKWWREWVFSLERKRREWKTPGKWLYGGWCHWEGIWAKTEALPSGINPCPVQVSFPLFLVTCRHLENYATLCEHIPAQKPPHVDKGRKFNLHRNQVTCWAKKPSVTVYLQPFTPPSHANTWTGWHAGASGHEISTPQGTLHHKAGMNLSLNLCMVTQLPWAHTEVFLLPFRPVQ